MKRYPFTVYLMMQAASAVIVSIIFTVDMVYQATVVGLSPLQLVLVGTALEATVFLRYWRSPRPRRITSQAKVPGTCAFQVPGT